MIASSAGSSPVVGDGARRSSGHGGDLRAAAQRAVRHRDRKLVRADAERRLRAGHAPAAVRRRRPRCRRRTVRGWSWSASARPTHPRAPPHRRTGVAVSARVRRLADDHRARHRFRRVVRPSGLRSRRGRLRAPHQHLGNHAHASLRSVRRTQAARRRRSGRPRDRARHPDPAVPRLQLRRRHGAGHRAATAQRGDRARGAVALPGARERDRSAGHAVLRRTRSARWSPPGCRPAAGTPPRPSTPPMVRGPSRCFACRSNWRGSTPRRVVRHAI